MPGGKGLNQAVATSVYPDVAVTFVTAMADDGQGEAIRRYLTNPGERPDPPHPRAPIYVLAAPIPATPTVAVMVGGKHHGMLAPPRHQRNQRLQSGHINHELVREALNTADAVLVTLDFPEAVHAVLEHVGPRDSGRRRPLMVLNAAPAAPAGLVAYEDLRQFDWIVPNVAEARTLLGEATPARGDARRDFDADIVEASRLAQALSERFSVSACVTASSAGCAWISWSKGRGPIRWGPRRVRRENAVGTRPADVTGASDAFCATFTYRLIQGGQSRRALHGVIRGATIAGSLAVETLGSSYSMPPSLAVERLSGSGRDQWSASPSLPSAHDPSEVR